MNTLTFNPLDSLKKNFSQLTPRDKYDPQKKFHSSNSTGQLLASFLRCSHGPIIP